MPLRVHCPSRCLLRLPTNRAGKVVRCPECKSVLRIPGVSESEQASGKPIPVEAQLVTPAGGGPATIESANVFVPEPAEDASATQPVAIEPPEFLRNIVESAPALGGTVDAAPNPAAAGHNDSRNFRSVAGGRAAASGEPPGTGSTGLNPGSDPGVPEIGFSPTSALNWAERLSQAIAEKYLVGRLFAVGMIVAGGFDFFPLAWSLSGRESVDGLPFWCWILGLVAGLHLVYALFAWQVRDWSALSAVATVELFWAAVLAAVVMALTLGGAQGAMAQWLGLGVASVRSAVIWCLARLCLAVIISYLLGREVYLWQRTERMLQELKRAPIGGEDNSPRRMPSVLVQRPF